MTRENLAGKVIVLTGFGPEFEPEYLLEFTQDFNIKAGDRISFYMNGYNLSLTLIRKEDNGEKGKDIS